MPHASELHLPRPSLAPRGASVKHSTKHAAAAAAATAKHARDHPAAVTSAARHAAHRQPRPSLARALASDDLQLLLSDQPQPHTPGAPPSSQGSSVNDTNVDSELSTLLAALGAPAPLPEVVSAEADRDAVAAAKLRLLEHEMAAAAAAESGAEDHGLGVDGETEPAWTAVTRILDSTSILDALDQRTDASPPFPIDPAAWNDRIHAPATMMMSARVEERFLANVGDRLARRLAGMYRLFLASRDGIETEVTDAAATATEAAAALPAAVATTTEGVRRLDAAVAAARDATAADLTAVAENHFATLRVLDDLLFSGKAVSEPERLRACCAYYLSVTSNISRKLSCLDLQLRLDAFGGGLADRLLDER
ncbi:hypothetical protein HK405_012267, partial [Cladochytrium tenue]